MEFANGVVLRPAQKELAWIAGRKEGAAFHIADTTLQLEQKVKVKIGKDEVVLYWLLDRVGEGRVRRDATEDHTYLRIERRNGNPVSGSQSYATLFEKDGLWFVSREGYYRSWDDNLSEENTWENAFRGFGVPLDFPVERVSSIDVIAGPTYGGGIPSENPWYGDGCSVVHGEFQWKYVGGTFAILWAQPEERTCFSRRVLQALITPPVNVGRLRQVLMHGAGVNN